MDMVAFSTDFCHFEGTGKDGPSWYEGALDGCSEATLFRGRDALQPSATAAAASPTSTTTPGETYTTSIDPLGHVVCSGLFSPSSSARQPAQQPRPATCRRPVPGTGVGTNAVAGPNCHATTGTVKFDRGTSLPLCRAVQGRLDNGGATSLGVKDSIKVVVYGKSIDQQTASDLAFKPNNLATGGAGTIPDM